MPRGRCDVGNEQHDEQRDHRADRHQRQEHTSPPGVLEEPATGDRPEGDAHTRVAPQRPMARARSPRSVKTFVMSESVVGKMIAAPSPMIAPHGDQLPRRVAQRTEQAPRGEDRKTGEQRAFSADAVGDGPGREHQRGEHEVVRVDDPLELAGRGVELADQRRQGHVDDGRVEVDRERREAKREQDESTAGHA